MLAAHKITYVQVESGMGPHNTKHVPFGEFLNFFETRGYVLFGVYGQIQEWWNDKSHLRFSNPVFISTHEVEASSKHNVVQYMYGV